jgi:hypothetical protein
MVLTTSNVFASKSVKRCRISELGSHFKFWLVKKSVGYTCRTATGSELIFYAATDTTAAQRPSSRTTRCTTDTKTPQRLLVLFGVQSRGLASSRTNNVLNVLRQHVHITADMK